MTEKLANLDPMIMGAVGVLLLALAIVSVGLLNSLYGPRARLERRLTSVGGSAVTGKGEKGQKAQSGMRRRDIEAKLKAAEQMKRQQRGYKLREKLIQAGLKTSPRRFWIYSLICGAVFTAIVYGASGILYSIPAALLVGVFGIPRFVLRYLVNRRLKQFTALFANAIDLIVRGVKTGMTVAECLSIVGKEMPDPVGLEFRAITESIQMGITLEDALNRMVMRVPSNEARFFAIVLITQQTTGGNLAETLAKLAGILRDRKKMRDKIKALSSEAKSSAAIIGAMPFAVAGVLSFTAPDYVGLLITTNAGNWCLVIGAATMTMGIMVIRKMINFEI
ncbi:MAG TPA: type II secretion system F family protein [Dongiaceae bacterium]|nr:type II secretion system F family protein [Dongiaceae bacterium]HSE74125.1 type II secretion system F family protein [Dongiaceae bacterium]